MVRYRVQCFPNLSSPRSAAGNTVLAAWIFIFFPFPPWFHSALFFGVLVSGSSIFNFYLQFSSSLAVFCHSKFLHLGAFPVIISLLSVFVCGLFLGGGGGRGKELQWASVSCRFREEWPTWAHSDQPCLNCISIYLPEKVMAPHSSTLAWKIPWTEEPGGLQSMGSQRVRQDWMTSLSLLTFMHWRRKWQPTPVFLPGESQEQRSVVGCRLWGRTESDTTEAT